MKSNWVKTTLQACTTVLGDGLHGTPKYDSAGDYYFINGNNLANGKIILKSDTRRVGISEYEKYKKPLGNRSILVSINGTLGNVGTYNGENVVLGKSACYFNVSEDYDVNFIKYVVSSADFKQYLNSAATGTTIKNISLKQMREYEFYIPPITEQIKISKILSKIDEKISLNQKINDNLEQQVLALYRNRFVDNPNGNRIICRADEYFDISIGKTPPRKEPQWFSQNHDDITWVSIADMGSCGLFIKQTRLSLLKLLLEY